jgi:hypothetical protein
MRNASLMAALKLGGIVPADILGIQKARVCRALIGTQAPY